MHHLVIINRCMAAALSAVFLCLLTAFPVSAAPPVLTPPTGERWFGILVDNDYVGFYRQRTARLPDGGYRVEGDSSVRMKVMGFTKEATSREVYTTNSGLALRSLEVEQTIGGTRSKLTGKPVSGGLHVRRELDGKVTEKILKAKGDIIPGPFLNIYPLMRELTTGKVHRIVTFDPEDMKVKDVKITVLGNGATPDGQPSVKLRNNLYPFVDNDIWVDRQGNTLLESVRDGLVLTRAEHPDKLAGIVGAMALSKKDLILDFSMVRVEPALKNPVNSINGLSIAIDSYPAEMPIISDGWQWAERSADRLLIKTGQLRPTEFPKGLAPGSRYISPAEGIESDSPLIQSRAREILAGKSATEEQARAISAWTARWLEDSLEDSGSAIEALQKKTGNCQSHAKLYTALARAVGIPTRFVSGLVSQDGKGFLYHSWAESWIDGRWIAVDPTFDQLPADPTHLALFEGHKLSELSPILAIIGKIRISTLEEK